ncbi:hypothetical protein FKM82_025538 [Ascaphus truei]
MTRTKSRPSVLPLLLLRYGVWRGLFHRPAVALGARVAVAGPLLHGAVHGLLPALLVVGGGGALLAVLLALARLLGRGEGRGVV